MEGALGFWLGWLDIWAGNMGGAIWGARVRAVLAVLNVRDVGHWGVEQKPGEKLGAEMDW